ncbi:hypothetical protein J2Z83_003231 [Virgibacillus natechei]|uniref:DUF3908 domain-containing protein n=1 Tax=Virgibacillus natechei TaxID=1216297 RepID=A0ABS4IJG2_9BACI|nr:DUF3908 family protein [Virgibacillus natechei]MBP1971092.1 hypothetical protein [Virgibacillus natechei]UZD12218.1 DUF3908 family protein [Virgibacillus natechei]
MTEVNFDFFTNLTNSADISERERYKPLVDIINTYIGIENIEIFYPKFLFVNDRKLMIFVFQQEQVSVIKEVEDTTISLTTFKYNNLKVSEIYYTGAEEPVTLKLDFNTGEFFRLNNQTDTNNTWTDHFKNKITAIYKLIT